MENAILAVEIILIALAVALLAPVLVLCAECLAAMLPGRRGAAIADGDSPRPRVAVLVPAHDEEAVLGTTLAGVAEQLRQGDRLVVVADNCTDRTADVARTGGATVVVRNDAARRGKGYALDCGVSYLAEGAQPDVVVIVDADCRLGNGAIDGLARQVEQTGKPAQAVYLMELAAGPANGRQRVSALAFLMKNLVRPRGLARLGLPCLLTGTGMAFPWPVLRGTRLASGNIVEDMQLGLDLAVAGHGARLCEDASVTGTLPQGDRAALGQRTRWEHGHLRTLVGQAPRLLWRGLTRFRPSLVALAMEMLVPPLSLLLLWLCAGLALSAVVWRWGGASWLPMALFAAGVGLLLACVLAAWLVFARRMLPLSSVLVAPFYVLWKIPMYLAFLVRPQRQWVRTERPAHAPPLPPVTPPAPASEREDLAQVHTH